jgi:predicted CXXCH cytochrome family protein
MMRAAPLLTVLALTLIAGTARARDAGTPRNLTENAACLECHGDKDQDVELENGEILKLYVDKDVLATSVHYDVDCTECHVDLKGQGDKHKEKPLATVREFAIQYSEQCKDCHFKNYTKALDGVHHKSMVEGKKESAVCVDCHGVHDIGKAAEPRSRIAHACARCHEKEAKAYAKSVHGAALLDKENPDVPTCADCHRAHDILDPKANATRLDSPQMCGNCHTDEKMMKKYKLSTEVLSSYLTDFHGATTMLQKGGEGGEKPLVALCTDCHGIHDITKVDDPNSRVIQANLVKTCQKCHEGATDNFPTAWLSHYEPSFTKAPLVYAVKLLYAVLIPFMIGSLVLQIALHLWRVVVNR